MEQQEETDMRAMFLELREWVKANTRRIEELEATAFQLEGEEDVLLIAFSKRPK